MTIFSVLWLMACQPGTTPSANPIGTPLATQSSSLSTPAVTEAPGGEGQVGYLEGKVRIGPLEPVESVDKPTASAPPEVYTSRSINIFQADGQTLVTDVSINPDGTYRVALPPGAYVVDIAATGIDRGIDLPKTITIESGQTVTLDIAIDTGIR
ncbi:MAG TPA: carboxypeptidase-like regulatory domain-containing protein [Anaerolineae bacterium]|nr:carboxypeptidase-like regulatory domain-containing protein [Anaerolineae bacterium]